MRHDLFARHALARDPVSLGHRAILFLKYLRCTTILKKGPAQNISAARGEISHHVTH